MRLLDYIPIKLSLLLIVGILLGVSLELHLYTALIFAGLSLMYLGILFFGAKKRTNTSYGLAVTLSTLAIGTFSATLAQARHQATHYTNFAIDGHCTWQLKVQEVLKPTAFATKYIMDIKGKDSSAANGKLLMVIKVDSTSKFLQVDDEILVWGAAQEIKKAPNPHQFNYKKYMARMGIYHQLKPEAEEYCLIQEAPRTIYGLTARARNKITLKLKDAGFEKDELGIIQALLLGQRNDISQATYDAYKNAGAVHILAISGLHIGILLVILQFLLRPLEFLPSGKTVKLCAVVLLLWGFAILSGLSPSVVRAVTMFSFVAYALYLNRPGNTFNILALSIFFILLVFDPMLLFHPGFQMSYAAVGAIVWIYPKLQRFWYPANPVIRKVWQLLAVSVAAQIGVFPISLFYFHQFPGLFFISNVVIVPFLGLILALGILVLFLAVFSILPNFIAECYIGLIGLMNAIVTWVAAQEAFIFKDISFDGLQLILSYIIVFTLMGVLANTNFKSLSLLLTTIIIFQLWTNILAYRAQKQDKVVVFHQTANSILLHQKGPQLNIYTKDTVRARGITSAYKIAERIKTLRFQPLKNSYLLKGQNVLLVDSLAIIPEHLSPDILWLSQSPRINLDRYLNLAKPKEIIADGSNYTGYVARWRQTCAKRKLPFHYTAEKGAYNFVAPDQ